MMTVRDGRLLEPARPTHEVYLWAPCWGTARGLAANGAAGRLGAIRRGRGRDAVALPVAAAGPRAIAHKESRAMMVDAMVGR